LLTEGYKDAAAVIAGSVLEDQLRKLGAKSNLPLTTGSKPKMLTELNQDLRTASVYNKVQMQVINGWIAIRNSAAHGQYGDYTKEQVAQMIAGIRDFITKYPA